MVQREMEAVGYLELNLQPLILWVVGTARAKESWRMDDQVLLRQLGGLEEMTFDIRGRPRGVEDRNLPFLQGGKMIPSATESRSEYRLMIHECLSPKMGM